MDLKILTPKLLVFQQFIFLSIGLYVLGNFWPTLLLDSTTDSLQLETIRFLFTFTFSVSISARVGILLLFLGTTLLNVFLLVFLPIQKLSEYFRTFYVILGIFHYFAWIFVEKYSPIYASQIRALYFEEVLLRGIMLFGIFVVSFSIRVIINSRKKIKDLTSSVKIPTIEFICPHCLTKYTSNVKYCINCHQYL